MVRRVIAAVTGMILAVSAPALALAADGQRTTFEAAERAMERGTDWTLIVTVTVAALLGLFLLTTIGYMYRRERGLDWEFQKPDAPHDAHDAH